MSSFVIALLFQSNTYELIDACASYPHRAECQLCFTGFTPSALYPPTGSAASHSDLLHHIAAAVHITLGILDHALNHLAADPACIAGGNIAVVALVKADVHGICNLGLETGELLLHFSGIAAGHRKISFQILFSVIYFCYYLCILFSAYSIIRLTIWPPILPASRAEISPF